MKRRLKHSKDRKSGQAIIFLIMVLVIGTIVVLWNFDLHNIVSTKIRIDNAGDAAALSAARWQGITLNMIGELNLNQVALICDRLTQIDPTNLAEREAIADEIEDSIGPLKRRVALVGPLMGLAASQSSAIKNLTEKDEQLIQEASSRFMRKRGADFEDSGGYYKGVVEEPYTGAWEEYGGLVSTIANGDVVAECGNTEYFLFYESSHTLLNPDFYDKVSMPDLCYFGKWGWFLLESYVDYTSWPPLPGFHERKAINSEYYSTDVYQYDLEYDLYNYYSASNNGHVVELNRYYADQDFDPDDLTEDFIEYLGDTSPTEDQDIDMMTQYGMILDCHWHYFQKSSWFQKRSSGTGMYMPDSDEFPFHEGWKFKEEFNYGGANAAADVRIESRINTPGMQIAVGDIYWQASAKPFGYLEDLNGGSEDRLAPMYYGIVLPAFHDVRLIHNGLSSRKSSVDYPGWDEHIYEHLPEYEEKGLEGIKDNKDCWYCKQLKKWEDPTFREAIKAWVNEHEQDIKDGKICNPKERYEGNPHMGRG